MSEMKRTAGAEGQVACKICLREIPKSVAMSHEGPDYVYYFCGPTCYRQWQAVPGERELTLVVAGIELDFDTAQTLARTLATCAAPQAMLLAWFDRACGRESPQVPECQHKPGWLAYAESHGGDLRVSINSGDYVFIFRSVSVAA